MERVSPAVFIAWQLAGVEAVEILSHNQIEREHIFLGILKLLDIPVDELISELRIPEDLSPLLKNEIQQVKKIFTDLQVNITDLRRSLRSYLKVGNKTFMEPVIHRSPDCKKMFSQAENLRQRYGHNEIGLFHLLFALLSQEDNIVIDFLKLKKIDINLLQKRLLEFLEKAQELYPIPVEQELPSHQKPSYVSKIGRDLTDLARKGKLGKIIGRDEEIKAVAQILGLKKKNNAILIGEPGVGKTAVVEGLAQKIVNEEFTGEELKGLQIVEIRMGEIMAGAKFRGDLEERLISLLREAEQNPKLVIFIDEIHTIMQVSGGGGGLGAADILKPALQSGEFRCIGATTFQEYKKYIESDPALQRRFRPIIVEEPTPQQTLDILYGLKSSYENHHGIKIEDDAIKSAVELSYRFLPDLRLPDKALDLLDEAAAMLRIHSKNARKSYGNVLTSIHIAEALSKRTHIPVPVLLRTEEDRLKNLKEKLERRIIGQSQAVKEVVDTVIEVKTFGGVQNKPLAVFMFVGATGTGKTEMAKALADILFEGEERKLLTFDMSEYMEEHSVSKFIGAPPGYIGYDAGGQLVEQVKRNPYSVILFDEVEKAHPKIFDVFLQIFDEARLTDGAGRKADFQNTYIILTSNVGSKIEPERTRKPLGIQITDKHENEERDRDTFNKEMYRNKIFESLRRVFRPEFLGRIPHIVVFYPFEKEDIKKIITTILLPRIEQKFSSKNIKIEVHEDVLQFLTERTDLTYGVRKLIQLLDDEITKPLTKALVDKLFVTGDKIIIELKDKELIMRRKQI